jgi:hypothetical protein
MKINRLIFLFAVFITCISCTKSSINPETIQPGIWISTAPTLQFDIKNTKGEGSVFKVLESKRDGGRFLKVTSLSGEYNYTIVSVYNNLMILREIPDSLNREISMMKVK